MPSNLELLGHAAEADKSVNVQMPNGSFIRMTPSEAKAYTEIQAKKTQLELALMRFKERQDRYIKEMQFLSLGGSDPGGKENLVKTIGRRQER